jgi:hypothetical protein
MEAQDLYITLQDVKAGCIPPAQESAFHDRFLCYKLLFRNYHDFIS